MPWSRIEDVPASVRTHKGVKLSLAQANFWGRVFDGVVASGRDKSTAAAIAWSTFERTYKIEGDRWVRRT